LYIFRGKYNDIVNTICIPLFYYISYGRKSSQMARKTNWLAANGLNFCIIQSARVLVLVSAIFSSFIFP